MKYEADQTEIDILLAAYFAGEADNAERAQVESWANASEENKKYFEASRKTWEASLNALPGNAFNTDEAWQELQKKIHTPAKPKSNYLWLAVAGAALIIGWTTWFFINRNGGNVTDGTTTLAFTSTNAVANDTLPDGTRINLNRNSELIYPSAFVGTERHVSLKGEAFFDVTHDAEHPFIIHTDMMDVKVLGTSFNVKAYPASDSVRVSVVTGKVQCMSGNDTVTILPGEFAVFHKGAIAIAKGNEDNPNNAAYRNRIFQFNQTPLGLAVMQLNDAYGCHIVLKNDALKNCKFTITKVFSNEPVENIIGAIQAIYPDITSSNADGNTIILDGPGCQ